ncbi:MAG: DUF6062 family protein [Candidatus Bathyarchaeia archaeon]
MSDIKKDILTIKIDEAVKMNYECPFCWLLERSETRYLETFYSEYVKDSWYRGKVIRSRGFCRYHFYRMLDYALKHFEKLGLALVLENIAEARFKDLKELCFVSRDLPQLKLKGSLSLFTNSGSKDRTKAVARFMLRVKSMLKDGSVACPACDYMEEDDKINVDTLAFMLTTNTSFLKRFEEGKGLCLPHLLRLFESLKASSKMAVPSLAEKLLSLELKNFSRLASELKEIIRKHDYRFHDEPWGSEIDAVERTVLKLIGSYQLGFIHEKGRLEDLNRTTSFEG